MKIIETLKNKFFNVIAAVIALLLSAGLVVEHVLGFGPCVLCVAQRIVYTLILILALAGMLCRTSWHVFVKYLILVASLIGLFVSGYQLNTVYFLASTTGDCLSPNSVWFPIIDFFSDIFPILYTVNSSCFDQTFSVLGVDLPIISFILFIFLVIYSVYSVFLHRK